MFNQRYHLKMSFNRAHDKNLRHFLNSPIQNLSDYENSNDYILQICDQAGLSKQTKYMVKKSLDIYVLTFPQSNFQQLFFAALNFVVIAVKFMEDPEIQSVINFQWILKNFLSSSDPSIINDCRSFEIQIYSLPEFELNFTTPYAFLELYQEAFLLDKEMVKRIEKVLDFSLTIPEIMLASAEELFFGVMLMIGEERKCEREWMLRQTFYRQKSERVGRIIKECYHFELEAAQREACQN